MSPVNRKKQFERLSKLTRPKILIINFSAIGDIICSLGLVRSLRKSLPKAEISFLVALGFEEILHGCPWLDRTIVYLRERNLGKGLSGIPIFFNLVTELRREHFDLILDLKENPRSKLISFLSGAPSVLQSAQRSRKSEPPELYYEKMLEKADFPNTDCSLAYWETEEAANFRARFLKDNWISDNDLVIGLNPGVNWPTRNWPVENWVALGNAIVNQLGAEIILFGGPLDVEKATRIAEEMKIKPAVSTGKTTLQDAAALIRRCAYFITNDSGLMHFAQAVGTPYLVLFGPTSPKLAFHPSPISQYLWEEDLPCTPCYKPICPLGKQICFDNTTPERVFTEMVSSIRH